MKIICLEGLPLVGKTTVCIYLMDYFTSIGKKSIYRHAQLTENKSAKRCIAKAFENLQKWNFYNKKYLYNFIKYRYEQIYIDFSDFKKHIDRYAEIDYIFLDRYITSHDAMSAYFDFDSNKFQQKIFKEIQLIDFLLLCDYSERKKRASNREKTNNFTLFSIKDYSTHLSLQKFHYAFFIKRNIRRIYNSHTGKAAKEIANWIHNNAV